MSWYVASLRDGDTHLVREVHGSEIDGGEANGGEANGGEVRALCGQRFRPLTRLAGQPPDPLQVCRSCWEELLSINA
ncbi:MAG: hypothetical protein ACT4NY_13000 [Pseudonocardiales bacterium]